MDNSFTTIEVCSGIGGLGLSVRLAMPGVRTLVHLEREIYAAEVLATRMEEGRLDPAPIWTDLTTFKGKGFRGLVDCVVAGIPCQGNSIAGKRELERDPRNLWPALRRTLRDVGAPFLFLENVPGIAIPERGKQLTAPIVRILGELAEDGYDAEWISVAAEDVGAPQRRERFFLLAYAAKFGAQRAGMQRRSEGPGLSGVVRRGEQLAIPQSRGLRKLRQPPRRDGQSDGRDEVLADSDKKRESGLSLGTGTPFASSSSSSSKYPHGESGNGIAVEQPDIARRQTAGSGRDIDAGGQSESPNGNVADPTSGGLGELRQPSGEAGQPAGSDRRICTTCKGSGLVFRRISDEHRGTCPDCLFGVVADASRDGGSGCDGQAGAGRGVCEVGGADDEPMGHAKKSNVSGNERSDMGTWGDAEKQGRRADHDNDHGPSADISGIPYWPPGPAARAEWERILAVRPDLAPATQSAIRGVATGVADGMGNAPNSRTDELRALGNAVVPACGAVAFCVLWQRFFG